MSPQSMMRSLVRFSYYAMFLRKWGRSRLRFCVTCSPISAVIWIKESELAATLNTIKASNFPRRLILNLVVNDEENYPINYLRNLGIPETLSLRNSDCPRDDDALLPRGHGHLAHA